MKIWSMISILLLAAIGLTLFVIDTDVVEKIKSGKADLICITNEGEKRIDPSLLVSFSDGRYYFTNGSATNCRVVEK